MTRTSQGLLFAAALAAVMLLGGERAEAQVVIQGQVSTYGQPQPTYGQPGYGQPQYGGSPYVAAGGSPQPVRYVTRSRSITALWVPGLIMTLVGWVGWSGLVGTSVWASCYPSADCPNAEWAGWMWIPIIGPWLSLAQGYPGYGGNDYTWFSVIGGLLEDVGLIMLILGLTLREEWEEPVYALGDGPGAPTLSFGVGPGHASATIRF